MQRHGLLFAVLLGAAVTLGLFVAMRGLVVDGPAMDAVELRVRAADPAPSGGRGAGTRAASRPGRVPEALRPPPLIVPEDAPPVRGAAVMPEPGSLPSPELRIEPDLPAGTADGDLVPIVRVEASYPQRALARRISGHCVVEYTVTTTGATRDAIAVDCEPAGEFEQASVRAVLKFKYRPRIVDGRPVEVHGVRNRFVYSLEQ